MAKNTRLQLEFSFFFAFLNTQVFKYHSRASLLLEKESVIPITFKKKKIYNHCSRQISVAQKLKACDVMTDAAVYEYAVLGTAARTGNCYRVEHGPRCLDETLGESVEQMLNITQQPVGADWL